MGYNNPGFVGDDATVQKGSSMELGLPKENDSPKVSIDSYWKLSI